LREPETLRVEVEETALAVRGWGDRTAPPLVFLHGLNVYSNALALNESADVLSEDYGFRVLALDAPGLGESPAQGGDYSPRGLARLYLDALDGLGAASAPFLGFSWGAAVAVEAALAAPDRVGAVVLVDGAYWTLRESPVFERFVSEGDEALERFAVGELDDLAWESEKAWLAWLAEALGGELRPAVRRAALAAIEERDGAIRPRVTAGTYATAICELFHWDHERALRRLGSQGTRVLLVAAHDETPFGQLRQAAVPRFRELVPQSAVVPLEGPHDLFLVDAEELGARIGGWLRNRGPEE
jgi:pimeloyl-ACP methyl ester carboxylesterase